MSASVSIRPATKDDIADLARVHLASKLYAEKGIIDANFLAEKTQAEYEEKWIGFLAAEDSQQDILFEGDQAVGFISYGQLRTAPAGTSKIRPLYSAEIFAIYIHPDFMGQGHGKALLQYAVGKLKEQKHQSLCLWALDKNKPACGFYEKMGAQRVGKQFVEMGPSKVKEVCYAWRDISVISQA